MASLLIKKTHHVFNSLLFKALPAAVYYGFPGKKLNIYGITGTDGKTTSSTLLYHTLKTAGYKVALISTVAAFIGNQEIDTGFHTTSPEPRQIQKLLKKCVDQGIEHVVLEVTSHGLFQFRVWGINFAMAGVTNITNEHLDYFGDWEKLAGVKSQLLESAKVAVINQDDQSYNFLKKRLSDKGIAIVSYSQKMEKNQVDRAIEARFLEEYNQWNAHLVYTMAKQLKVNDDTFVQAVKTFPGVKGRMQNMPNNRGIRIVVDFAHTPNALLKALTALCPQTSGRLIAVFGCAGLRDTSKRPAMAQYATEMSDLAVFTAEDPRTEDILVIIRQMKEGVTSQNLHKVVSIPDRREAIIWALREAKKGDTVGIFGKGHEQSMAYGSTEYPWSDQVAVNEVLQELEKGKKV